MLVVAVVAVNAAIAQLTSSPTDVNWSKLRAPTPPAVYRSKEEAYWTSRLERNGRASIYSSGDGCRRCFVAIKTLPVPPAIQQTEQSRAVRGVLCSSIDEQRTPQSRQGPDCYGRCSATKCCRYGTCVSLCTEALLCHRWSSSVLLIRRGPSYCVSMLTCFRRT